MCVMNHNWSATKQRLHPQSVAEISCRPVYQLATQLINGQIIQRAGLGLKILTRICYFIVTYCFIVFFILII